MTKRLALGKYWPVALFAVSNIAAVTLVIKANTGYQAPAPATEASWPRTAAAETEFTPLDSIDASRTGGDYTPLLFDWGNEFDLDAPRTGGTSFLSAVGAKIRELGSQADEIARKRRREALESDLMRQPLNVNYYNRSGSFLGRSSFVPPFDYDLPPLSPVSPLQFRSGQHDVAVFGGGDRTIDVQVDPELFRDPQAMTSFITGLTQAMVEAGVQPRVKVARAPVGPDRGGLPLPRAEAPLPPVRGGAPAATVSVATPLPRPPADVVKGAKAPVFQPNLAGSMDHGPLIAAAPAADQDQPLTAVAPPALGPGTSRATAAGDAPAVPAPAAPRVIELAGSATPPSDTKPVAAAPAPRPEPKVSIRVQLARFPDKVAAERALAKLQDAGFGGVMRRDSGTGLDYWVVYTKAFTSRGAAGEALARIRGMGYEAWQS